MTIAVGPAFVIKNARRNLLSRNGRPIGHITWNGRFYSLWLQNYAGYYSDDFVLEFNSQEQALARAEAILAEWDESGVRSVWIA